MVSSDPEVKASKDVKVKISEMSRDPALRSLVKSSDNPFFKSKYLPLDAIEEAICDAVSRHSVDYFFSLTVNNFGAHELVLVVFNLENVENHLVSRISIPSNDVLKPQEIGSAITYYKRYLLCAMFKITGKNEDDDGNQASNKKVPAGKLDVNKANQLVQQALELTDVSHVDEFVDKNLSQLQKLPPAQSSKVKAHFRKLGR